MVMDLARDISFEMEIKPPFNLKETMLSGQTNEAAWLREADGFTDLEILAGTPVRISIMQKGSVDHPALRVHLISNLNLREDIVDYAARYLTSLFRLDDNLELLYRRFKSDPIATSFVSARGLRLMKATDPFESLICAICSQNTSVKRWNSMVKFLKQRRGHKFTFHDNSGELYSFPEPYALSKAKKSELIKGSLGYRADYVREASALVDSRDLDLEALGKTGYHQAYGALLEVKGIGPKVADCFCLYGLGFTEAAPIDRWVERAVSHLYFAGCRVRRRMMGEFIRRRFGAWAGYAQLYLFHYWRTRPRNATPVSPDVSPI